MFTVDNIEFVSVFAVSVALEFPATRLLQIGQEEGDLVSDNDGWPLIKVSILQRFPKLKRLHGDLLLSPRRVVLPASLYDVDHMQPRKRLMDGFPYRFLFRGTDAEWRAVQKNGATTTWPTGVLHDPTHFERVRGYGQWRTHFRNGSFYFHPADLENGTAWSTEAERSWTRANEHLAGLVSVAKRRRAKPSQMRTLPTILSESLEAGENPAALRAMMKAFRQSRMSKNCPRLQPGSLAQYSLWELPLKAGFNFWSKPIQTPVGLSPEDTAACVDTELLLALARQTLAWADFLQERRTGYLRASGHADATAWRREFAEAEEALYMDRLSWNHPAILALMPPGFQFLF